MHFFSFASCRPPVDAPDRRNALFSQGNKGSSRKTNTSVRSAHNSLQDGPEPVRILNDYFVDPKKTNREISGVNSKVDSAHHSRPCLGDYTMVKILGKGSFGKVILVRKKVDQKLFAMKVLEKSSVVQRNQVANTRAERRVLEKNRDSSCAGDASFSDSQGTGNCLPGYGYCPFIVQMHAAFQSDQKLYFVLDYCRGGELFVHLSRARRFPTKVTRFYTAEIVLALEHLHAQGVVYRDMKPENVLLDERGHLKLVDFGLAKENVQESTVGCTSFCGTPEYLAPEMLARTGHGQAVDWWGLGMLVYEMLTGLPPWYTEDRRQLMLNLRSAELTFPQYVTEPSRSFIGGLLNKNPSRRLGATEGAMELKRHIFFSGLNWIQVAAREVPTPINPSKKLKGEEDVSNFHPQFTRLPLESDADRDSLRSNAKNGTKPRASGSSSSFQSHHQLDQFSQFTYGTYMYAEEGVAAAAREHHSSTQERTPCEASSEVAQ
jgi:serine/threonine protein kinase